LESFAIRSALAEMYPETADSFLAEALHCFEQANHGPFAAKARAHHSSAQFRSKLEQDVLENREAAMSGEMEASVAQLLATLFRESLWVQAAKVCQLVLPHLPECTQEQASCPRPAEAPSPVGRSLAHAQCGGKTSMKFNFLDS
jgi:hypothetical protein